MQILSISHIPTSVSVPDQLISSSLAAEAINPVNDNSILTNARAAQAIFDARASDFLALAKSPKNLDTLNNNFNEIECTKNSLNIAKKNVDVTTRACLSDLDKNLRRDSFLGDKLVPAIEEKYPGSMDIIRKLGVQSGDDKSENSASIAMLFETFGDTMARLKSDYLGAFESAASTYTEFHKKFTDVTIDIMKDSKEGDDNKTIFSTTLIERKLKKLILEYMDYIPVFKYSYPLNVDSFKPNISKSLYVANNKDDAEKWAKNIGIDKDLINKQVKFIDGKYHVVIDMSPVFDIYNSIPGIENLLRSMDNKLQFQMFYNLIANYLREYYKVTQIPNDITPGFVYELVLNNGGKFPDEKTFTEYINNRYDISPLWVSTLYLMLFPPDIFNYSFEQSPAKYQEWIRTLDSKKEKTNGQSQLMVEKTSRALNTYSSLSKIISNAYEAMSGVLKGYIAY
ncbi:IpaD/SipD/SspD family type III secretion system needle tip protein [Herbaspirillum sp. RTI4]|uniref:IpaD/SipD/SspD family type III secretion system needle tip protein n=1 Tax=Herbaspirillum sp. RTI4 TaxID=3048640 RepID=UPI002AB5312C|nr:IpaD/SipD/SspD family type III secretion system needle tip protein [Herbaspirillum sp. RTI4]MDY7578378.1 IpaD/SipD/SspD family type III secretion system needle tip protein [Herbaspirillum sp. RTI4]